MFSENKTRDYRREDWRGNSEPFAEMPSMVVLEICPVSEGVQKSPCERFSFEIRQLEFKSKTSIFYVKGFPILPRDIMNITILNAEHPKDQNIKV